jgi:glycine/D-amino acid oxidase-like deaminating enzyme
MERTLVVGAGIFGVTAAIELRKRGHAVRLVDPGPLPHPLAASTDISKVVRLEYGADETYTALSEGSLPSNRWNRLDRGRAH